jgi:hypothetical protein
MDVQILKTINSGGVLTQLIQETEPDVRSNGHNPLHFVVRSLLSEKLGLSEQIESRKITFDSRLRAMALGTVTHPDHDEKTCMYNIFVSLSGNIHIPASTSSYRRLMWASVNDFIASAATKDLTRISTDLSPFEYCIHGLCVLSTYNLLTSAVGGLAYPFTQSGEQRDANRPS